MSKPTQQLLVQFNDTDYTRKNTTVSTEEPVTVFASYDPYDESWYIWEEHNPSLGIPKGYYIFLRITDEDDGNILMEKPL